MRKLRALPLRERYWRDIEKQTQAVFNDTLFKRLFDVLGKPMRELRNAYDSLSKAIEEGRVWYEDGKFHGEFNARISKDLQQLGATYNTKSKTWSYTGAFPAELSTATALASIRFQTLRQALVRTLDDTRNPSIDALNRTGEKYTQTIKWMEDDFQKAVQSITITPRLTDNQIAIIARDWGENLNLYIKGWLDKEIIRLRKLVQDEALSGRRAESLAKVVQQEYGVSRRKAEFLARQETSLLMSNYHQVRYKDAGVRKFIWQTAEDERVRESHRHLNGKTYSWDMPPMNENGQKIWPGTDFGCRCVAIPVLD